MMLPNSSGQGHVCLSFALFVNFFVIGETSVQLYAHLVFHTIVTRISCRLLQSHEGAVQGV